MIESDRRREEYAMKEEQRKAAMEEKAKRDAERLAAAGGARTGLPPRNIIKGKVSHAPSEVKSGAAKYTLVKKNSVQANLSATSDKNSDKNCDTTEEAKVSQQEGVGVKRPRSPETNEKKDEDDNNLHDLLF